MNNKKAALASFIGALLGLFPATTNASDEAVSSAQIQEIMDRLEKLEKLVKEQEVVEKDIIEEIKETRKLAERIKINNTYGNTILDPTTQINQKQQSHRVGQYHLGLVFLMLNREDCLRIRLDIHRLRPVVVGVLDMLRDLLPGASTIARENETPETRVGKGDYYG